MQEIALECTPDEALIKALGFPGKRIYHQSSKGEVINFLRKNPGTIGVVDEDPGTALHDYFHKFQKTGENQFDLECYHIPKTKTRLIVIKPRLEEWILKYSKAAKVKSALPANAKELHKVVNKRIPQFEKMLKDMLENNSPAMEHLKGLIGKK